MSNSASALGIAKDHGSAPREIIRGLDALRFVTAMWVAFSHGARFPIERVINPDSTFHKVLYLLNNTTFNGTAAVSVFFLISGFLIHQSNLGKPSVATTPFWIRRGVRIGVPLLIVLVAAQLLGPKYVSALDRILWSVYAELVYYFLYPLLLPLIRRFGISKILASSLLISLMMIGPKPSAIYLWEFGHAATWLFCAPLWLMGCYLADNRLMIARVSRRYSVWLFRLCALLYCYISTILATHAGALEIGYTWTIWPFGIFCMFWLDAEIAGAGSKWPQTTLERFGLAGYSLYLTHRFALTYLQGSIMANLSPVATWLAGLGLILGLTWIFYRFIEWPGHQLARLLGRSGSFKDGKALSPEVAP